MAERAASNRVERASAQRNGIAPYPGFVSTCTSSWHVPACVSNEVSAIDNARADELVPPMQINPVQFARLTPAEQVFASTNLERIARGLQPIAAMTSQLNAVAERGAKESVDPALTGSTLNGGETVLSWASNWAGGLDALEADYYWVYDDGEGLNIDCKSVQDQGCWEHRSNVLLPGATVSACHGQQPVLVMGAAVAMAAYHGSAGIAEILVELCGGLTDGAMVTWESITDRISL